MAANRQSPGANSPDLSFRRPPRPPSNYQPPLIVADGLGHRDELHRVLVVWGGGVI